MSWHSFWAYSAHWTSQILALFREEIVSGCCYDVSGALRALGCRPVDQGLSVGFSTAV